MIQRLLFLSAAVAAPFVYAQTPRRDLAGIWEPVPPNAAVSGSGAKAMPADGQHEPPYTPYGLEVFKRNRPSNGPNQVSAIEDNDPAHICDPQGFPREDLFELRATQIIQTPLQMVLLYTYDKIWRVIWTDGRELPKDPEARWFGYSVGKWRDDSTFVAETNGTDERTWLDNAGRPHSDELRVEEVFHLVDRDTMQLTVTINDPKIYAKPWIALDKLIFKRQPPNRELAEMLCSPSETAAYNKRFGKAAGK